MEQIYLEKTFELRKNKSNLEKKLNVRIALRGKTASVSGTPMDEYEASQIIDAIGFGFSAKKALKIKEQEMEFRKINIKNFTKRKNLSEVKARIIGKKGQTKRTLEEISGCDIILSDNAVGIIGLPESIESAITGITNLIKGTKQANVYRYLERTNKAKKQERNLLK